MKISFFTTGVFWFALCFAASSCETVPIQHKEKPAANEQSEGAPEVVRKFEGSPLVKEDELFFEYVEPPELFAETFLSVEDPAEPEAVFDISSELPDASALEALAAKKEVLPAPDIVPAPAPLPAAPAAVPPAAAPAPETSPPAAAPEEKQPPAPPKNIFPAEAVRTADIPAERPAPFIPPLPARIHPVETEVAQVEDFSRKVRAVEGQIVEVPFRGSGWVFTGEKNGQRGLAYQSRKTENEGQLFVFNAQKPGTYFVKFNKQDFVNNRFLNDTVQVVVEPYSEDLKYLLESRAAARPETFIAEGLPAGTHRISNTSQDESRTSDELRASTETPLESETENISGDGAVNTAGMDTGAVNESVETGADFFSRAREDFAAKKYPETIAALDLYKAEYPYLDDEMYWMYGQSFEANTPARNIKAALDSYKHITSNFPLSKYYDGAKERISYLNKYYFNIR